MSAKPELSVLLPALNEAQSLESLLPALKAELDKLGVGYEILVVDGGSTDETVALAKRDGCRVILAKDRGFGSAVREGIAAAQGEFILEMDADGSHPPRAVAGLWAARQKTDLAIASRYVAGGSADMSLARSTLSRLLNHVCAAWLGWPICDASSGLRLYRAARVKALPLSCRDFGIQQEALAYLSAHGGKTVEIPFHYGERVGGESKADALALALSYLRLLWRLKILLEGPQAVAALCSVLALGLVTGLWGITWGLPGAARLRAFPERLKPTPEIAQKFSDSWARLYEEIERAHEQLRSEEPVTYVRGVSELKPGWDFPPDAFVNSYRALLLQSENPDEKKSFIILGRMRPWRFEFKPLYAEYGGTYTYPLGAVLAAASAAGAFKATSDLRYYLMNPQAMGKAYLAGRLFIVLFHVATLWLLFDMGAKISGWKTGAASAAFFALTPAIVVNSHLLKPHPYAAFFCLAAVRYFFIADRIGRRRDYWLGGMCAGWAAGANIVCAVFAIVPFFAYLSRRSRLAAAPRELPDSLWAAVMGGAVCLAANPFVIFNFRDYLWEATVFVPAHGASLALSSIGPMLFSIAPAGLGWAFWMLSLAGLARWALKGGRDSALVMSGFIAFAFFWTKFAYAGHDLAALRLYYPLIGVAALAAADLVIGASVPDWAKALAIVVVLLDCGARSAPYLANMSEDAGPRATRVQAAEWIEKNVPAGATLGLTRYPEPAHAPYLRYDLYHLVVFDKSEALDPGRLPEWLVVDQEGAAYIDNFTQKNYHEAATFLPVRVGWARVRDGAFFANEGLHVFRRNQPG